MGFVATLAIDLQVATAHGLQHSDVRSQLPWYDLQSSVVAGPDRRSTSQTSTCSCERWTSEGSLTVPRPYDTLLHAQVKGGTSATAAAQAAATTIAQAVAVAVASATAKVTTSGQLIVDIHASLCKAFSMLIADNTVCHRSGLLWQC